jgi:hypothetical protein
MPKQHPVKSVPDFLSRNKVVEVMNEWSYIFSPRLQLRGVNGGKGRAVPLQAWSGPDGSKKLRFLDYVTTSQDGDKVVILTHRPPLPPGNVPGTHFC